MQNWGFNFKCKEIVDTYLNIGKALPLKYFKTLEKWHANLMVELNELESERPVSRDERAKFFKFFTEKGNLKMSAEAVYCFLANDPYFKEAHTAEQDCIIEYEIYKAIKKKVPRKDYREKGSWANVLQDFFNKFQSTEKQLSNLASWRDEASYTDKLINQYLK